MDRETTKLTLGNRDVHVKTYLTAREAREVTNAAGDNQDIDKLIDKLIDVMVTDLTSKEALELPESEFIKLTAKIVEVRQASLSGLDEKKN